MAYITLSNILSENIEKTVLRGLRPREVSFAQIYLKFSGRNFLGKQLTLMSIVIRSTF